MAEGSAQLKGGKLMLTTSGKVSLGPEGYDPCCSPCLCCDSNNFEATIEVTCVSGGHCECAEYASSVTRSFSDTEGYCQWTWEYDVPFLNVPSPCAEEDWTLLLTYTKATKIWSALFSRDSDPGNFYFMGGNLDVTCSGGRLSGTFVLNGVTGCGAGGENCTAEIVL